MKFTFLMLSTFLAFVISGVTQSSALERGDPLSTDISTPWQGDYKEMLKRRKIRVLIPFSKTFFFIDGGKLRGLAVDMLQEFEKSIKSDVKSKKDQPVVFLIPTRRDRIIPDLLEGLGDIAIANLTITDERRKSVDFSKPFGKSISELLVTPGSHNELNGISDIAGLTIHVRASSSYFQSLQLLNLDLKKQNLKPVTIIKVDESLEDEDLLEMVNAELLPAIIIDSHKAAFWSQVFKNLKIHKNVQVRTGGEIAWAIRKDTPDLKAKINSFAKEAASGTMLGNIILKRYYRDTGWLKKATSKKNMAKLTALDSLFQKYGKQYDIDWLILAALAFQESRLDQNAKGPRGAVGIMQIKPSTAASSIINIPNVHDVESNIKAGAKYLRYLADQYFAGEEIDDLNRILFALASYNAGPNRIAGLRKKTKTANIWFDNVEDTVSQHIGAVTVHYVLNIYQYYVAFKNFQQAENTRKKAVRETLD